MWIRDSSLLIRWSIMISYKSTQAQCAKTSVFQCYHQTLIKYLQCGKSRGYTQVLVSPQETYYLFGEIAA